MSPLRGILLKIASVLVFVAMSSLIKVTSDTIPPGEAVFFRSLFAIPVILIWLWWRAELGSGLRTKAPMGHVWRGVVGTASMGFVFAALGLIPLPEATAIGYASPILAVVFAAMFLGEEVRLFRLAAVALGMVGVLIILTPNLGAFEDPTDRQMLGAVTALAGAVCGGLAQVFVRKLVMTEATSAVVFWFMVTAAVLSLVTLPFGWVVPTPGEAALLVMAGLLGGLAQILLTSSYRFADASIVAPFEYASMMFALLIGYVVFNEVPTLVTLGGAALVILAGVMIIWRERQLGLARARQRKAMTPQG